MKGMVRKVTCSKSFTNGIQESGEIMGKNEHLSQEKKFYFRKESEEKTFWESLKKGGLERRQPG